jgi:heme ABC exporter ATP-binding subunit CcmA
LQPWASASIFLLFVVATIAPRRGSIILHIRVRDLSKAFGAHWALRSVDLEFRPGECAAILGPNGAGKTTLLKTLAGLVRPTHGGIEMDGEIAPGRDRRTRGKIGFFTPGEHLYADLTVEENLRLFTALYDRPADSRRMESVLAESGVASWSRVPVSSLSAGLKSRAVMAKWMLVEPELFLVDEPYGALDGKGVDLLEAHLRRVVDRGGTVLIATHHIRRVLSLCSRAVVLQQSRVAFDEARRIPWDGLQQACADFLPRGESWDS